MTETANQKFSLSEQLLQRFNLLKDPFADQQTPFFHGAQRQYILDTLRHLVNFGDMVLLLTGDKGSGKTTVIKELVKKTSDQLNVIPLISVVVNTPRELIGFLFKGMDILPIDAEPVYRSINRVMEKTSSEYKKGIRTLFVVDDAEALSADVFQLLIKTFKELGSDSGAVLLLAGKPEMLQMVIRQGVQPEQCDWMHQLQLKPFTVEEMVDYLQRCFDKVGGDKLELTEEQKDVMLEMGKGNPGRINRVAPAVLLRADRGLNRKQFSAIPAVYVKVAVGGVGILLLSFILVGYQYGLFFSEKTPLVNEDSSEKVLEKETVEKDVVREAINAKIDASLRAQSQKSTQSFAASEVTATEGVGLIVGKPVESGAQNSVPEPIIALAVVTPPPKKIVVMKVQSTKKATPLKRKKLSPFQKSSAWLRAQAKTGFVVQLSSNKSQKTATDYIRRSGYSKKLFYVKTERKSGSRYVVLYGIYKNQKTAKNVVSKMPVKFKKQKPWVRSVAGIQNELGLN